jgi:hypothetical protein
VKAEKNVCRHHAEVDPDFLARMTKEADSRFRAKPELL